MKKLLCFCILIPMFSYSQSGVVVVVKYADSAITMNSPVVGLLYKDGVSIDNIIYLHV